MICEYCGKEHNGAYGSGRFCLEKCARGFSSREKREEINRKVSVKLKGRRPSQQAYDARRRGDWKARQSKVLSLYNEKIRENKDFKELGKRWQRKVLYKIQKGKCAICHRRFIWRGMPLKPEMHHKDGNRENKTLENSELICPNCHSQTKNHRFNNRRHSEESKKKTSHSIVKYWENKKLEGNSTVE